MSTGWLTDRQVSPTQAALLVLLGLWSMLCFGPLAFAADVAEPIPPPASGSVDFARTSSPCCEPSATPATARPCKCRACV